MRTPERLSHSGFALWESNPEEFYLKYLAEHRPPRIPQERPAAAGSAFDAYVKASLKSALDGSPFQGQFAELFEAQVEPQNRDWAIDEGAYIFECYKISGFYQDLLDLLLKSSAQPRFEFTIEAIINGVPFTGKPDCQFALDPLELVHDWKVNGFCSKYPTSPHKSYMLCRDGWVGKQSKSHGTEHKEFLAHEHGPLTINASYLEAANPTWADQLSLYAWALGEKIGDENVVLSVHQVVAKPASQNGARPQLRVASYRARVKAEYQRALADRLKRCWDAITGGYVFPDLSREDSDQRCADLEETAVGLLTQSAYCNEVVRAKYRG